LKLHSSCATGKHVAVSPRAEEDCGGKIAFFEEGLNPDVEAEISAANPARKMASRPANGALLVGMERKTMDLGDRAQNAVA